MKHVTEQMLKEMAVKEFKTNVPQAYEMWTDRERSKAIFGFVQGYLRAQINELTGERNKLIKDITDL